MTHLIEFNKSYLNVKKKKRRKIAIFQVYVYVPFR